MIRCFDNNDIGTEVWTKQKTQRPNLVRLLWFTTRQAELSELFVRTQHHQLRSKHNSVHKYLSTFIYKPSLASSIVCNPLVAIKNNATHIIT